MEFRTEQPGEYRAVENLVREAFWNIYKPGCDEHLYLHQLRQSPVYLPQLSFTAWEDGKLVGQIACARSHVTWAQGGVLDTITFGPLAVLPRYQKQGLARALVCHALRAAQAAGQQAAVILGDPRHYGRYGFWCGERWGIALENGLFLPGLQAVELTPGALAHAAGRFCEGFAYDPDPAELEAFDGSFPVKEKAVTDFQREFQVMCALGHEVRPNGFMQ